MKCPLFLAACLAAQFGLAAELSAFHPTAEAALDQAHRLLTEKFLAPDGLLLDYVGEIPTPKDCAEARPNAMGWWSPIENGPMFTGPYLAALCEKVRRGGSAADRAVCRKMAAGLLRAASVSSVKGMIVRGFATDGSAHYPLGSEDQTLPWFFGLHAYAQSGIPTPQERAAVVAKMTEVAEALEALAWKCPCDGRFTGESRGNFRKGLPFRGASHYLFILRAMADVTGSKTWLDRYVKACHEKPEDHDLTRLEICAKGYETDLGKFGVEPNGLWIYVCAQGCLKALAKMDGDWKRRPSFFAGLKINAERARRFFDRAAAFDNATESPFRYANWRTGYAWRDQPTQKVAGEVANSGDKAVLGNRKWIERSQMTTPLSACAIVAYAGREDDRAAIAQVLRHYDYASLNISEFFLAEVAWYALPEPAQKDPVGEYAPEASRLLLRDNRVWRPSPPLGSRLTVEYVFVPRDLALLPPGADHDYGRSLLNIGSGYYSGLRLVATRGLFGLWRPQLQVGRPKGSVSCTGQGLFVPDVTNQLFVTWNGAEARFVLNGKDAGGGTCVADWTVPENDFLGVGFNNYGIDALPQQAVRVRIWNRVLSTDEITAEYVYRSGAEPREMRLQESLRGATDGVADESRTSAALEALAAGVKVPAALQGLYTQTLETLRLREGKTVWGADALADDDGRPRHRPVPPAPTPGCEIFVAPDGDDRAAGSEAAPLRTLRAAQGRVREIRRKGLPAGGVAVNLRGGTHAVESTLELTEEDSGEPGRPVVWRAYREERPVLDGGYRVTGFAPAYGKVLVADVRTIGADALVAQTPFGTHAKGADERIMGLYFNGEPLTLARDPNEGWYTVGACVDVTNRVFRPAGVADLSRWTKDREPELMALGYWKYFWADATTEVDEVDVAKGTVRIRDRGVYTAPKAGQTFRFVNALAALDEPGEWFLDRAAGKLYVWPTAPGGTYVLTRFGGAFVSVKKAHDVRFEGLTLQYGRGHGVTMAGVKSVVFAGNVVRRFGGRGLQALDARDTLLVGNVLHTFGHMAVDVSSGDRRTLTPGGLVVANNEIWDPGRAQRTYSPGIHAYGVGIEMVHNHIHDVPSSAIMPGGNDHYVGWNLVERVVTESDDQGGIDMWGDPTWAGTRMCWNIWRDIGGTGQGSFPAGRAGIRLDDAISGMSLYGNRFINSSKGHFGGVQIHAGRFNRVENNLFVGGVCGVSFTDWGQKHWGEYFVRSDVRNWLEKTVNASAAPFPERYPHLVGLADAPMTNIVARNVFAETERVFRNPPRATAFRGNLRFSTAAAAEAAFGSARHLRALPPEREIGTYADPVLDRARRSDGEP